MKEHIIDYINRNYTGGYFNDFDMLEEIQKRGCTVEVKNLEDMITRSSYKMKIFKDDELIGELVVASEDTGTLIEDIQKIKPKKERN